MDDSQKATSRRRALSLERFADWFKSSADFKQQRPYALISPGFSASTIASDEDETARLSVKAFLEIASDDQPRVLSRETLRGNSEFNLALEKVWRRVPRFVVVVPVDEGAGRAIALLGRQAQPETTHLPELIDALRARALESLVLPQEVATEVATWERNSAPCFALTPSGRPLIVSDEARRLFDIEALLHLEQVLPGLGYEITARQNELTKDGVAELPTEFEVPRRGRYLAKAKLQSDGRRIVLMISNMEQVRGPKRRESTRLGLMNIVESQVPRPTTGRYEKQGIIRAWLCCEPLPPIPLGPKFEVTIGRNELNDLVLPHKSVSRNHATIKVHGTTLDIEDLTSSNGIFINGEKRKKHILNVGDQLQIGPYELSIRAPDFDASVQSPSDTTVHTQISMLGAGAALVGNLGDTPLAELLQSLEFNSKTGTLTINDGERSAYFSVIDGKAHSARFEDRSGSDAVIAMLHLKHGQFSFSNKAPTSERTMNTSITSILLDASRLQDEAAS